MEGESALTKANAAECPVCMELYQSDGAQMPYVLQCAHTLRHACTEGIKTTDNKTSDASWRCPSCQAVTTRDPKPNYVMRDMMDTLSKMRVEPVLPATLCENCEEALSTLWCQTCEVLMCQSCMDVTHSAKVMQRHPRVSAAERAKLQGPPKCSAHGEVLKYMCMECQVVSCIDCMNFGEHKGHNHELITAVAEGYRNHLREGVAAAEAAEATAAAFVRAVEAVVDEIGAVPGCCGKSEGGGTLGTARQQIALAFANLRAALDAREGELTAMVGTLANEKVAQANEQLHQLGMHRSMLHAARECAEAAITMAAGEVSARFKLCLDTLQAATDTQVAGEPMVDSQLIVHLPVNSLLRTVAGFGSVGGLEAPQHVLCDVQGPTAVLTWQAPELSALPVLTYGVERAVGDGMQYVAAGRSKGPRFEQQVDELAGRSVIYRVRAEDEAGNIGPWRESSTIQLPEAFGTQLRFQAPFDANGVLYHISTAGGTRDYRNTHSAGAVVASMC